MKVRQGSEKHFFGGGFFRRASRCRFTRRVRRSKAKFIPREGRIPVLECFSGKGAGVVIGGGAYVGEFDVGGGVSAGGVGAGGAFGSKTRRNSWKLLSSAAVYFKGGVTLRKRTKKLDMFPNNGGFSKRFWKYFLSALNGTMY